MTLPKNGQPRQRPVGKAVSPKIAAFLLDVLNTMKLDVGDPGFEEVAGLIGAARRELRPIAGVTAMPPVEMDVSP